jgi:dimethylglycine catabolism B
VTSLRLPLLEPHRAALETCVYCPKLSRAACPVSNAEASETVTPWGKMSMAYFAARGDVPVDEAHAAPAWACTSCYACREACDHKNEVAPALLDARAEMMRLDAAPPAAKAIVERWPARQIALAAAVAELESERETDGAASTGREPAAVLVGCGYVERSPEVARDALRAAAFLLDRPVRPVRACCGLPLLYAGDRDGFADAVILLAREVASAPAFLAIDPGCARALLVEAPRVGVEVSRPEIFVDLAARSLEKLRPIEGEGAGAVRYHDPCQLGRGLGRYEEPRAILARITGAAPERFLRERAQGECSGGGGLLPATRPESSRAIADARIAEHRERGGGTLVTACASSLQRFRSRGEAAEDLVSLVARAIP